MNTEAEKVAQLAVAAVEPRRVDHDSVPFAIVPQGSMIQDLEHTLTNPVRAKGNVTVQELPSFARYVEKFGSSATAIFAVLDPASGNVQLSAVLDYHKGHEDGGDAGWKQHIVIFNPPLSEEWCAWTENNGEQMDQRGFAEFLEDRIGDVVKPSGAELLEIGKTFKASKQIDFRSAQRLSNGTVQFTYNESVDGVAGASGNVPIPETFTLGLPMWRRDLKRYEITAKLRYRLGEGKLSLWFELVNLPKVIEHAHAELLNNVEKATKITPFLGSWR